MAPRGDRRRPRHPTRAMPAGVPLGAACRNRTDDLFITSVLRSELPQLYQAFCRISVRLNPSEATWSTHVQFHGSGHDRDLDSSNEIHPGSATWRQASVSAHACFTRIERTRPGPRHFLCLFTWLLSPVTYSKTSLLGNAASPSRVSSD